jgi:hypothetical protein
MSKQLRHALLGVLCATTTLGGLPADVLAGPMSAAPPATVGLTAPVDAVHYYRRYYRPVYRVGYHRRYAYYPRRAYYYPRRVYYGYPRRHYYGYDPSGAIFASAALGLMGAGIAAATAPRWGYGGWGWGGGWGPGWGYGGWGGPGWGWGGGWW